MADGAAAGAAEAALIRRRHVIYVEGYDPQGAQGYYRLFDRSWTRFLKIWPLKARLGELKLESPDFARWDVDAAGPNWQVSARYDFLRQEHFIRANMAEPLSRQIPRALAWALDYLVSGAIFRVLRASLYFGLVLIYFQLMLIAWIVLPLVGGFLAALATAHALALIGPLGWFAGALAGAGAAVAIFLLLRRLAGRWFIIQINNHWPYLCEFARGEATCFDAAIEAGARRVVAAVRANEADEIIVVGHSGGGALAPAVVVRALELDPDSAGAGRRSSSSRWARSRREPRSIPRRRGCAPSSRGSPPSPRCCGSIPSRAPTSSTSGISIRSRGSARRSTGRRCNPLIWKVRFGDMLSRRFYWRIRFNFFRLHYQFIMASDRRAPYDYFMLVCGPVPIAAWARDPNGVLAAFGPDGALIGSRELARRCYVASADRRSMTACGTGAPFIVPLSGSPCTQTRVSKPSTASVPFLCSRWCTSKLER